MKLTRLRLTGFKSFVEPTDFEIEPGLTGVVGPNGCGKSNLVEAVRWVMGEASYKAMRASEMDDVIFSGNADRPARNHAEVAVRRQRRPHCAGGLQRFRDAWKCRAASCASRARPFASTAARCAPATSPCCLPTPRPARARRRCPPGPYWRDHPGPARPAPARARRGGRHFRPACPAARGRIAAQGRRAKSDPREDVIGQLAAQVGASKTQARQAVRYRNIWQVRRTEALLFHLRWIGAQDRSRRQPNAAKTKRFASSPRAPANRYRPRPSRPRSPPTCPPCARPRPGLPRRCSASLIAREALEREEARAKERIGELDRRIEQYAADLERERALVGRRRSRQSGGSTPSNPRLRAGAGQRHAALGCRSAASDRRGRR